MFDSFSLMEIYQDPVEFPWRGGLHDFQFIITKQEIFQPLVVGLLKNSGFRASGRGFADCKLAACPTSVWRKAAEQCPAKLLSLERRPISSFLQLSLLLSVTNWM